MEQLNLAIAEIRPIPGHPGYFVSSDGKVYSQRTGLLRELVQARGGKDGAYRYVSLGREFRTGVHQLVAEVFCPKPDPMPTTRLVVRHRDNIANNNVASNLEWGTQSQNLLDRRRHGTAPFGEKNPAASLSTEQVIEIRRLRSKGVLCRVIAEAIGTSVKQVSRISLGRRWPHLASAVVPSQTPRKVNHVLSSEQAA